MTLNLKARWGTVMTAALCATVAPAQIQRPDVSLNPRLKVYWAVMKEANVVLLKAKTLLDVGDDMGAERETDRYLIRIEALETEGERWMAGVPAHWILAEVYVRQRRFAQALEMSEEKSKWGSGGFDAKNLAVKAVALVGLNRLDDARATLERCMAMGNVPVNLREGREDLPAAKSRSAEALIATAWLIHGLEVKDADNTLPRARRSIEEALRLAPKNPVVALNAARFYREVAKRPDLARKALKSSVGGSRESRALIDVEQRELDRATQANRRNPNE